MVLFSIRCTLVMELYLEFQSCQGEQEIDVGEGIQMNPIQFERSGHPLSLGLLVMLQGLPPLEI